MSRAVYIVHPTLHTRHERKYGSYARVQTAAQQQSAEAPQAARNLNPSLEVEPMEPLIQEALPPLQVTTAAHPAPQGQLRK